MPFSPIFNHPDCIPDWTPSPALGTRSYITLSYGATDLDLRCPKLGDNINQNLLTSRHENVNGIIIEYHAPYRISYMTLSFEIEALSSTQKDALLSFLMDSAGKEIGLTDHDSREWLGVILTPEPRVIQDGKGCQFSCSLDFCGVLQ